MEKVQDFINNINKFQIVSSIIVILISLFIYKAIAFVLTKQEENDKIRVFSGKKSKTYLRLIRSLIRYVFIIITILVLLQINGINVSSLLAGVGILSVVIGLAIQDWLKDIIRGSSILSDNYFSVGDVIKYKEFEGKVLVIGLKTTKIQDIKTNNIISIANRNIEEVQIVSNLIFVDVPIPYEISVDEAEKAVSDVINEMSKSKIIENARYIGVKELGDSAIYYSVEVTCNPLNKRQANRDGNRAVLVGLEKNGISVPYMQIDVHNKE